MEKRPPSQRQLRVGEEIRHVLAGILMRGDVHAPELERVSITVSEVRISPDLKNATAYVMPLNGEQAEEMLDALEYYIVPIRKMVISQINLRFAPRLNFKLDRSFDEAMKINQLLSKPEVARDLLKD